MGITPIIAAAATIGGAVISSSASSDAAQTQASAAQNASQSQLQAAQLANQTQLQMYQQTRSDLAPYMQIGQGALGQLASLYGINLPAQGSGSPLSAAYPGASISGSPQIGSTQVPGGGGIPMSPLAAAVPGAGGASPSSSMYGLPGNIDWATFLKNNPDIAQWAAQGHGDPNAPPGTQTPEQAAAYWVAQHQQTGDDSRVNNLPMLAATAPAGGTGAPQAPTTSITGIPLGGTPGMPTISPTAPGTSTVTAGSNIPSGLSTFANFPGYTFGFDQGVQALDRSAASRGLLLSGGQEKDLMQFGDQYAMQQAWGPYISGLTGLASQGESSAAGVGNAGISTGAGIASTQLGAGNALAQGQIGSAQALAAGQIGQANALTGALQNGLMAYQLYGGGAGGANPSLSSDPAAMSQWQGLY